MRQEVLLSNIDTYRRRFLAGAGVVATAGTVAPGLLLRQVQAKPDPEGEASTDQKRWGMLIDVDRLPNGGQGVVEACKAEHGWGNEVLSNDEQKTQWVRSVKVTEKLTKHQFELPVMCQHCETAPCVDVCPTGASFKRADGIVLVDKHICIGCRYCMIACPYKARSLVHEAIFDQKPDSPRGKGTVEACTLCVHKIDVGEQPACVASSAGAIVFGDLNDATSEISQQLKARGGTQIRADLGLNTGVRYQGI
ncbi:MAG TPA: 4Fe-4S dicluster domain-containing protein [Thiotrichaceae bacterium]|nr:4Fe-4S dicluster domain-containing protein [Thiotrichaceae bacterium]